MKNIILILCIILATAGFWAQKKWKEGPSSILPFPYQFAPDAYAKLELDAPIVIVGDRLAHRLSLMAETLSKKISVGLSRPIKVASFATKDEGLHRTLYKIKSLKRPPLIIIYLGGTQEYVESKFNTKNSDAILKNFDLYDLDKVKTLLMIWPDASRLIYRPIPMVTLNESISVDTNRYQDTEVMKRNEVDFKLFKYQLEAFFDHVKSVNTYLISVTAPVNIDIAPRKACDYTIDRTGLTKLKEAVALVKNDDYKAAYNITNELLLLYPSHAPLAYTHGQVAKKLNKKIEAYRTLQKAASFDCERWRGSAVYNNILRQVSQKYGIINYDFEKMIYSDWQKSELFLDDIYPQSFYYEKLVSVLASRIKKVLKL